MMGALTPQRAASGPRDAAQAGGPLDRVTIMLGERLERGRE